MRRTLVLLALTLPFFHLAARAQQWQKIAPLITPRDECKCIVLNDGRILVIAGKNKAGTLTDCEIYDPVSNTFSRTGSLHVPRRGLATSMLPGGKVIVTGGETDLGASTTSTCEIWDPQTGQWTLTDNLREAAVGHQPVVLPDSSVLFIGGLDGNAIAYLRDVNRYLPSTNTMSSLPAMPVGCYNEHCMYLPDLNGVMVVGGQYGGYYGFYLRTAAFYSFATGSWSLLDSLVGPVCSFNELVRTPNGELYILSGRDGPGTATKNVEHYSLATKRWNLVGTLPYAHGFGKAFVINDDSLLVVGGSQDFTSAISIAPTSWFSISQGKGWPGPVMNFPRAGASTMIESPDPENPCIINKTIYTFGAVDQNGNIVDTCEKLVLRTSASSSALTLSPTQISVTPCDDIIHDVVIANTGCDNLQLVDVSSVDSSTALTFTDQLPLTITSALDTLHFHITSLGRASIIPIRLTFQDGAHTFTKFVYLFHDSSATVSTLSFTPSVAIDGTVCDNLSTTVKLRNPGCTRLQITDYTLIGNGSANFSISGAPAPIDLSHDDSTQFVITCIATKAGQYTAQVSIHSNDGSNTFDTVIQVVASISTGSEIKAQLLLSDVLDAHAGDTITVPIRVYNGGAGEENGFAMQLAFNMDLLTLLAPSIGGTNSSSTYGQEFHSTKAGGDITVEGPLTLDPRIPLINLRFYARLSDTSCTSLRIIGCQFADSSGTSLCVLQSTMDSAEVCLTPVCGDIELQSALRSFREEITSISVRDGGSTFEVGFRTRDNPTFSVFNVMGEALPVQILESSQTKALLDLGHVPTGVYMFKMQTAVGASARPYCVVR